MKELDVLLTRFLERDYLIASSDQRAAFGQILDWQDPDLARYLLSGEQHTDPNLGSLFERIRTA